MWPFEQKSYCTQFRATLAKEPKSGRGKRSQPELGLTWYMVNPPRRDQFPIDWAWTQPTRWRGGRYTHGILPWSNHQSTILNPKHHPIRMINIIQPHPTMSSSEWSEGTDWTRIRIHAFRASNRAAHGFSRPPGACWWPHQGHLAAPVWWFPLNPKVLGW